MRSVFTKPRLVLRHAGTLGLAIICCLSFGAAWGQTEPPDSPADSPSGSPLDALVGNLLEARLGALPRDPEALAARVIDDVAEIRGLEFQRQIGVSNQSVEEFEAYLAEQMDRSMPPERATVYGKVIKKLGLYNGPEITDAVELMKFLATSQAAAYYSPEQSAFFVLVSDVSMFMLAPIYAHELYHGLQDQYWDLDAYLLDGLSDGLNDDEMLARQAVVEGEATYLMTLWLMRELTGQVPAGFALDLAVEMQANMDATALREVANSGMLSGALSEGLEASMAAMDEIPQFLLESLIGVYLKGMGFVHQAIRGNWDLAAQLYTDPPKSSEQILHPEKWQLQRDDPVTIELPDLGASELLEDWTLLDSNVIGEFQWRIIFREFGLSAVAENAAGGWDGDRFAVLANGDDLLLLLYSTWDSEAEAAEFGAAYEELLTRKYEGDDEPTRVLVEGRDVIVVEGGPPRATSGLIELLANSSQLSVSAL